MNRRDTIKSLLAGSITGGLMLSGCTTSESQADALLSVPEATPGYGRTEAEMLRDAKIRVDEFLNSHELETISYLADIILPKSDKAPSAMEVGVIDFIDFIVKDMVTHQLPIRGGVMWLDIYTNKKYGGDFIKISENQRIETCDLIAYPGKTSEEFLAGEKFFTLIRNLVLTGYYTTKEGIKDLGYSGNTPNVWDGVPQEVLDKHGLAYEEEWLEKCLDVSTRDVLAEWDDEGNLLT